VKSTPGCDVVFVQGTDPFLFGVWVCDRMATTHMLKRIQYRCLRIALGLMHPTHVQTLEVIGGVPPLRLKFSMMNHNYFILAFSTGGHPLRRLLAVLSAMNSTQMVWKSAQFTITRLRRYYACPISMMWWIRN
jgi:hypothetical protein